MRHRISISNIFKGMTVVICLLTAAGSIGTVFWLFDLASHFQLQYILILLICGGYFVFKKQYRWMVVSFLFIFIHIALIAPLFKVNISHATLSPQTYRVMFSNVLYHDHNREEILTLIADSDPDFIVLAETSQEMVNLVQQTFPHYVTARFQDGRGVFGIGMLAKHESLEPIKVHFFSGEFYASLEGTFEINGKPFTLIGTHPYPPISAFHAKSRNKDLLNLATYTSNINHPKMVIGDLNITSWSPYYAKVEKIAGVEDSRRGFGLQPSWPKPLPYFLRIPIDHALISEDIVVLDRYLGPDVKSDHLPVFVDIGFKE